MVRVSQAGSFNIGDTVQITGLQAASEYNNCIGKIISGPEANGRFGVRFAYHDNFLERSVKPTNLAEVRSSAVPQAQAVSSSARDANQPEVETNRDELFILNRSFVTVDSNGNQRQIPNDEMTTYLIAGLTNGDLNSDMHSAAMRAFQILIVGQARLDLVKPVFYQGREALAANPQLEAQLTNLVRLVRD